VEPLGLALGLGVSRGAVLLLDTEKRQHVFERVAAAGEPGGVDGAVIGERARWRAVALNDLEENGHDNVSSDRLMGRAGQQEPGVVIKPVENLNLAPVAQAPVDEVGLPRLVGLVGLEAQP
jgi:hypothetical protein